MNFNYAILLFRVLLWALYFAAPFIVLSHQYTTFLCTQVLHTMPSQHHLSPLPPHLSPSPSPLPPPPPPPSWIVLTSLGPSFSTTAPSPSPGGPIITMPLPFPMKCSNVPLCGAPQPLVFFLALYQSPSNHLFILTGAWNVANRLFWMVYYYNFYCSRS